MVMTSRPPAAEAPLPLENGDYLTIEEFERRYEAMPEIKKAELIEGVVYLGSPVSVHHGRPHLRLSLWAGAYLDRHPDLEGFDNTTVRLDTGNEYQPDLMLVRTGGRATISGEGYVLGAPELVIEVAASSASIDLHTKLRVYERNGVPEYIVWRVRDGAFDWFALKDGKYRPLAAGADGVIESRVFPGLRMPVAALLAGDYATVMAAVRG